ncbi:hypothetical protein MSAN_01912400 [Mycena sanguinolenta]|uniref:Uncharacterized protein n=1 Tax=Mycena sanguinolenta TaxID=230812 RepID=A0A8H6XQ53_9AGAR|nr:hypothetical protein MSAN_01912400 [Mycena sanguinolenta]
MLVPAVARVSPRIYELSLQLAPIEKATTHVPIRPVHVLCCIHTRSPFYTPAKYLPRYQPLPCATPALRFTSSPSTSPPRSRPQIRLARARAPDARHGHPSRSTRLYPARCPVTRGENDGG